MKLLKAKVKNFGSYEDLEFDFSNLGLTLVHGATGAGKSTLQDIPSWILFGFTGKDGNVDEVRSWTNNDEPTFGQLEIQLPSGNLTVTRIRGSQSKNDLYIEDHTGIIRGRSIPETQDLIEQRIGITKDLYICTAYFNEYSPSLSVFSGSPDDRRELFEKITNLEMPSKIGSNCYDLRKENKRLLGDKAELFNRLQGKLENLKVLTERVKNSHSVWERVWLAELSELKSRLDTFEQDKSNKINDLSRQINHYENNRSIRLKELDETLEEISLKTKSDKVCKECGQVNKDVITHQMHFTRVENDRINVSLAKNPYIEELDRIKRSENISRYTLEKEAVKVNPHSNELRQLTKDIESTENEVKSINEELKVIRHKLSSLNQLSDLSRQLRGKLLEKSISEVEKATNGYLEKYFDAELRVSFTLEKADSLHIEIYKNSHKCVYKQLSKGQRGLLKLCFSIAMMKAAANQHGVHFNTLFFDEALDGLDEELKVKSFGLFNELALTHESVLLIDHCSVFLQMFDSKFYVNLCNDKSEVTNEV